MFYPIPRHTIIDKRSKSLSCLRNKHFTILQQQQPSKQRDVGVERGREGEGEEKERL